MATTKAKCVAGTASGVATPATGNMTSTDSTGSAASGGNASVGATVTGSAASGGNAACASVADGNETGGYIDVPVDCKWVMQSLAGLVSPREAAAKVIFEVATEAEMAVRRFGDLAAYNKEREGTLKSANATLAAIHNEVAATLAATLAEDPSFPLKTLPPLVITGSVAHGTSYPAPGRVDCAWVCANDGEVDAVGMMFVKTFLTDKTFFTIDDVKTGKAGTCLAGATFGTAKQTKLGLTWIPFAPAGSPLKFALTLRPKATHEAIEAAAKKGYADRFKGDAKQLAQYIQTQHMLAIVKTQLDLLSAKFAALSDAVEKSYADNKAMLKL